MTENECDHCSSMVENTQIAGNGDALQDEVHDAATSLNASAVQKQKKRCTKCYPLVLKCIYISSFSMLGCLIRVGLDHAVGSELANIENPSSVIFKSFFSNMLGSFMMGFTHALPFNHSTFLFIGLTTGLCGSLTTYSKWNQQVSMLLVGAVYAQSQSQLVALSAVVVGLLSFVCSYQMGRDTCRIFSLKQAPPWKLNKNLANLWICFLFASLLILLTTIASLYWNSQPFIAALCLSAIFGPVGALGRYFISKKTPAFAFKGPLDILNNLPSGTLVANMFGSILLAITVVVECWLKLTCTWQIVLMAIQSGAIASLTTVSTFVAEVVKLRTLEHRTSSYIYAVATLILCVSAASLISGINHTLLWTSYGEFYFVKNGTFYDWKAKFQPYCSL